MAKAFRVILTGSQEVPANSSTARGVGTIIFDPTAVAASYSIVYRGLDFGPALGRAAQTASTADDVTSHHVHNAARGVNGSVVFGQINPAHDTDDLSIAQNADGSWTVRGRWETTDSGVSLSTFANQLASAQVGSDVDLYFNAHTTVFPAGLIRGQWVTIADEASNRVVGTADADLLPGLGGSDRLFGRDGNDTLDGGTGSDALFGQNGDDLLLGRDGNDTADGGAGRDLIFGQSGNDFLLGRDGNDRVDGGTGRDLILGQSGDDFLLGRDGNDRLDGGAGRDRVLGQGGDDLILGRDGNDRLDAGSGNDVVLGQGGDDVLAGRSGRDRLDGGLGDDTLLGQDNIDRLLGRDGNDRLDGGRGGDVLFGGDGNDTFVFGANFGNDVVADYGDSAGNQDTLWLVGLFRTEAAVLAASSQVGDNVVIRIDGDNSITLRNFDLASFGMDDFRI